MHKEENLEITKLTRETKCKQDIYKIWPSQRWELKKIIGLIRITKVIAFIFFSYLRQKFGFPPAV